MQIILLLLEVFLPEFSKLLAGSESRPLRRRLFRAGFGLLVVCAVYLAINGMLWLFQDASGRGAPLTPFEIGSLIVVFLTSTVLVLLSRLNKETASPSETHDETKTSSPQIIRIPMRFDRAMGRSITTMHTAGWRDYLRLFDGGNPSCTWRVDLDGVIFLITIDANKGFYLQCASGRPNVINAHAVLWRRPRLSFTAIDEQESVYVIEVIPEGVFVPRIAVLVNGQRALESMR